ncbi:hypothetical protein J6590_080247 [Homalodisca vitripennis]|nr:hypothetical protein J6590_080247 [Homalodisca vitripennis]
MAGPHRELELQGRDLPELQEAKILKRLKPFAFRKDLWPGSTRCRLLDVENCKKLGTPNGQEFPDKIPEHTTIHSLRPGPVKCFELSKRQYAVTNRKTQKLSEARGCQSQSPKAQGQGISRSRELIETRSYYRPDTLCVWILGRDLSVAGSFISRNLAYTWCLVQFKVLRDPGKGHELAEARS